MIGFLKSQKSYFEHNKMYFSYLLQDYLLVFDIIWKILIPIHTSYSLTLEEKLSHPKHQFPFLKKEIIIWNFVLLLWVKTMIM